MKSPVTWFGGKGMMVRKLLPLIPPHHTYVEVFGGGASLLFAKRASPVEVYNDVGSGLVNFFRVLRDPGEVKELIRRLELTPYSREEFKVCRRFWQDAADPVEKAYLWFVMIRHSFSGTERANGWKFDITETRGGMAKSVYTWRRVVARLAKSHERFMRVQIENDDFRKVVQRYDTEDTFVYLDPPYHPETRRRERYQHELTHNDHEELISLLLSIEGKAILSGYAHPIYEPLVDAGWNRLDFEVVCHAGGHTRGTGVLGKGAGKSKYSRLESVWVSPNAIVEDLFSQSEEGMGLRRPKA